MSDQPLLTIVTIVKEDPAGLARTAKSIDHAMNDAPPQHRVEWIIVDGSQSKLDVPAITHDNLTTQYIWQEATGIYPAMNAGLQAASGDYIWFLNAGDTMRAGEAIQQLMTALTTDQPTWLYGQVAFIQEDGVVVVPKPFDYRTEKRHHFARGRFPAHQGTVAKRTALLGVGGFDTSYRITADYVAMLNLSRLADPIECSTVLADFELGGASSRHWVTALIEFRRARRNVYGFSLLELTTESMHAMKVLSFQTFQAVQSLSRRLRIKRGLQE